MFFTLVDLWEVRLHHTTTTIFINKRICQNNVTVQQNYRHNSLSSLSGSEQQNTTSSKKQKKISKFYCLPMQIHNHRQKCTTCREYSISHIATQNTNTTRLKYKYKVTRDTDSNYLWPDFFLMWEWKFQLDNGNKLVSLHQDILISNAHVINSMTLNKWKNMCTLYKLYIFEHRWCVK